jgi:hypothetical protein
VGTLSRGQRARAPVVHRPRRGSSRRGSNWTALSQYPGGRLGGSPEVRPGPICHEQRGAIPPSAQRRRGSCSPVTLPTGAQRARPGREQAGPPQQERTQPSWLAR